MSHYQFLREFELLNDTRADVREKRWADTAVRELMRQANRVSRAKEEIASVAVEARRVHTAIRDEELLYSSVLEDLIRTRNPIYGAVVDYVRRRLRANAHILASLRKIWNHPRFSGQSQPGIRRGAPLPALRSQCDLKKLLTIPLSSHNQTDLQSMEDGDDGGSDDDEHKELMFTSLTDFIAQVHV